MSVAEEGDGVLSAVAVVGRVRAGACDHIDVNSGTLNLECDTGGRESLRGLELPIGATGHSIAHTGLEGP